MPWFDFSKYNTLTEGLKFPFISWCHHHKILPAQYLISIHLFLFYRPGGNTIQTVAGTSKQMNWRCWHKFFLFYLQQPWIILPVTNPCSHNVILLKCFLFWRARFLGEIVPGWGPWRDCPCWLTGKIVADCISRWDGPRMEITMRLSLTSEILDWICWWDCLRLGSMKVISRVEILLILSKTEVSEVVPDWTHWLNMFHTGFFIDIIRSSTGFELRLSQTPFLGYNNLDRVYWWGCQGLNV